MRTVTSINSLRKILKSHKKNNKSIGFVPTMGAFHEGHLSLIRKSRRENDITIVSIFVNPMQFSLNEDFAGYPRQKRKDELFAKRGKVDIIFYPSKKSLYPDSFLTFVETKKISNILCGKFRPGHFRGVTTIVAKLLNIVSPDTMYLGKKDFQQAVILKRMVADLNFPVRIISCPTIREKDGLALSSRNAYLTDKQRQHAGALYQSLKNAKRKIQEGERSPKKILSFIRSQLNQHKMLKVEYIACVNADDLSRIKRIKGDVLIALAVHLGKARLIDNIVVHTQ